MIGTRGEWLAARLKLLEAEKELTRQSDALVRRRQELPWVRVDKAYRFETDDGSASLTDLFAGRSQLVSFTEQQQREGCVDYNYQRGRHAIDATPAPAPVGGPVSYRRFVRDVQSRRRSTCSSSIQQRGGDGNDAACLRCRASTLRPIAIDR